MSEEKGLGSRVKTGYLWSLLGVGLGQPLSFVVGVVLARVLEPEDFGIMAACLIFTDVASTVISSGYVSSLLRKKEVTELDKSTVFVMQLVTCVVVAAAIVLAAPAIAGFMDNELIAPVLSVLAINFILLAFNSIPSVNVRRDLNFRLITMAGVAQVIIYGGTSIAMALTGFGVWSLVAGKLAGQFAVTAILIAATSWKPDFRFDRSVVRSLWATVVQFSTKNILDDIAKNIDYFIVGRVLGMVSLGFYSRAYYLMTFPISKFSMSLGNVLFPAFSKIQDENEKLKKGFIKSTCLISITTFPILIGLHLATPSLIPLVYGPKWLPTIVPLQIICFAGLFYSIDSPAISLINAKGFLKDEIFRQLVHLAMLVAGVYIGSMWGLAGATTGVVITALIYWFMLLELLKKRIGLSVLAYIEGLMPATAACVVMAAAVLAFQRLVYPNLEPSHLVHLAGTVFTGAVAYPLALLVFGRLVDRPALNDAMGELDGFIGNIFKSPDFKLLTKRK